MPAEEFLAAAVDEAFRLIFAVVLVNKGNKEGTKQSCGMKHYSDADLSSMMLVLVLPHHTGASHTNFPVEKKFGVWRINDILSLKGRQTVNGLVGRFPLTSTMYLPTACYRHSLLTNFSSG